jgi:hypothetical protein
MADENALEAELQRYLQNHTGTEELDETETVFAAPGVEPSPSPEEQPVMRPISIEEFPPLPPMEDAFKPSRDAFEPAGPPRLSADDEAALIAELQRYLKTDEAEGNEDVLDEPGLDLTTEEEQNAPPLLLDAAVDVPANLVDFRVPERLMDTTDASITADEAPRVVEVDGRTYEEPKPRHWPSVASPQTEADGESQQAPRPARDWEPL